MSPSVAVGLSVAWTLGAVWMLVRVRLPRPLTDEVALQPSLSVVVPARNEARSIVSCVESICASEYPDFEVVVVDDRSEDDTGALARAVDPGQARAVSVLEGTPVPSGWLGKPWACHQGSQAAQGDLLLFTDADTWHHPGLLRRAVASLQEDRADALTVVGRQEMLTFWEKLVQPQVFFGMAQVFPNTRSILRREHWRRAIANGQYLLFNRDAYDGLGGHGAVRASVVEDLRLAQILTRDGYTLTVRYGADVFSTRMYRSLGELVAGWSKNSAMGARQIAGRFVGSLLSLALLILVPLVWLLPPALVFEGLVGDISAPLFAWAAWSFGVSVLLWGAVSRFLGVSAMYGLLYPLGACVLWFITAKSLFRGTRVEWKGRQYVVGVSE